MFLKSLLVSGGRPLDLLATSCAPATESNGSEAAADLMSSLRFTFGYPSGGDGRPTAHKITEPLKRLFRNAKNVRRSTSVCATLGRSRNRGLSPQKTKS